MRQPAQHLECLAAGILAACGTPAADAESVARLLVEANLAGLDSHGIIRVVQYVKDIRAGRIVPGATLRVVREAPATALLDNAWNFGQLGGLRAVDIAAQKAATSGLAGIVLRRCRHVGCLGLYTRALAERGFLAFGLCGAGRDARWVCPWGGREARLSTNPLSFAAPGPDGPIVADFSTSALAEGKVRVLMHRGEPLPPDCILDSRGRVSRDPKALYADPPGAILPMGGAQGYKGFGLSLMVHTFSALLGGLTDNEGTEPFENPLWLMAVSIAAFMTPDGFLRQAAEFAAYLKSAAPAEGSSEILLPGEPERRTSAERRKNGIPLDDETWRQIESLAKDLNLRA